MPSSPPDAPLLGATVASATSVNLTWSTPAANGAAITGYKVYRGTSSGSLTLLISLGVTNSYTSGALTSGTTYYYAVTAANGKGESPKSSTMSAVPAAAPGTAGRCHADAGQRHGRPELDRPGRERFGDHRLQDLPGHLERLAQPHRQRRDRKNVHEHGSDERHHVLLRGRSGERPRRGRQVEHGVGIPSGPPADPILADPITGNGSLILNWSTPANNGAAITGYKIYRGTSSTSLSLLTTVGAVNTYTNTGLTNGTTYHYAVSAINAKGEGARSCISSGVPSAPPSAPTITVTGVGNGSVSLDWAAPAGNGSAVTGYKIFRGTDERQPRARRNDRVDVGLHRQRPGERHDLLLRRERHQLRR